jgi:hypothetical protein
MVRREKTSYTERLRVVRLLVQELRKQQRAIEAELVLNDYFGREVSRHASAIRCPGGGSNDDERT